MVRQVLCECHFVVIRIYKKKERRTGPLVEPRPRGAKNSAGRRSFLSASQALLLCFMSLAAQVGRFLRSSNLTLSRLSYCADGRTHGHQHNVVTPFCLVVGPSNGPLLLVYLIAVNYSIIRHSVALRNLTARVASMAFAGYAVGDRHSCEPGTANKVSLPIRAGRMASKLLGRLLANRSDWP
jgi:hypothetical protein